MLLLHSSKSPCMSTDRHESLFLLCILLWKSFYMYPKVGMCTHMCKHTHKVIHWLLFGTSLKANVKKSKTSFWAHVPFMGFHVNWFQEPTLVKYHFFAIFFLWIRFYSFLFLSHINSLIWKYYTLRRRKTKLN